MEALFQIVGCVVSSKPAAERVDEFVAQVRRERGVVVNKDALGASFVRFNAADPRLVVLACQAVQSHSPSTLRFGFASGTSPGKGAEAKGQDSANVSQRSITQAGELAAAARDGEVLVSPQLAVLLIESGLALHTRRVHLADGRVVPACSLELDAATPAQAADSLGSAYRGLLAQAGDVALKQAELEARLDAALGKVAVVERADKLAAHLGDIEAELDAQLKRVEGRLQFIGRLEERVGTLQAAASNAEGQLAALLARRADAERLQTLCDSLTAQMADAQRDLQFVTEHRADVSQLRASTEDLLGRATDTDAKIVQIEQRRKTVEDVEQRANHITHMLGDMKLKLEMLDEQRTVIDHVDEKLARLDFTVQEAQNTLRALQREREVAERIEQGLKALRNRPGVSKLS
jgi:archaellum component FlaC